MTLQQKAYIVAIMRTSEAKAKGSPDSEWLSDMAVRFGRLIGIPQLKTKRKILTTTRSIKFGTVNSILNQ